MLMILRCLGDAYCSLISYDLFFPHFELSIFQISLFLLSQCRLRREDALLRSRPNPMYLLPWHPKSKEQESRDQVDLFLKDYDKYMEQTVKDAWRDVETISASINTLF